MTDSRTRIRRRVRKVRVVYVWDGIAYNRPPGHRQSRQLTRQELDQLKAKYQVILERVD